MKTWPTWCAVNLDKQQLDDPAARAALQQAYCNHKAWRSEIIEAALFIESRLDLLLCLLIVGDDAERRKLFTDLILASPSFTFMDKWKLLRSTLDIKGIPAHCITEAERKSLLTALGELIADRNKYAHGYLYVDGADAKVQLHYHKGTKQIDFLNVATVDGIIERANSLNPLIQKLIEAL